MNQIPFSVYDFFGYLACGFFLLIVTGQTLGLGVPLKGNIFLPEGSFILLTAYIIGQIMASPSAWLLERHVVRGCIGLPSVHLFQDPRGWRCKLFPGFTTPLPEVTRQRILDRARKEEIKEPGEALFLHALATVKKTEVTLARLNAFLVLYGFCRNMTFVFLVSALLLAWGITVGDKALNGWWVFFAVIAAIGMFYRYLKFFRQYAYEVFITYVET